MRRRGERGRADEGERAALRFHPEHCVKVLRTLKSQLNLRSSKTLSKGRDSENATQTRLRRQLYWGSENFVDEKYLMFFHYT